DSSGNVVTSRKYDVYGAVRSSTGPAGSSHRFVGALGHASEDASGLVYMRARYMDAATGGFLSEDPARSGSNWFAYAGSCPTTVVDASGRSILDDVLQAYGVFLTGDFGSLGWVPGGPGNFLILLGWECLTTVPMPFANACLWTYLAAGYTVRLASIGPCHPVI